MPNSPKSTPGGAVPDMPGPMPATEKAAATRPPADNGQHRGEPSHPGVPLSPPGIIPESDVRVGTPSAAPPPHEHGQINEGLGELPAGYGDGRLVGLVRDPATLYVYWDFSQQQIEQAFTGLGPGRAMLKLWNARGSDLVREAEVHLDARGWYVRELPPGSELRVELRRALWLEPRRQAAVERDAPDARHRRGGEVSRGALCIVLHAHLPYVRHPEYPEFLEEDWLYEAITETYLPLLEVFDRAVDDAVPFRVTLTLTPPLVGMLRDELLVSRYAKRLDSLCELTDKEVHRTRNDPQFGPLARHYREHHYHLRRLFHDRYKRDLVGAFKRLQDHGVLEVITCGATHGFLPLMVHTESVRAQIRVAAAHYRMHFGRDPRGIWLPECGYAPGIDRYLAEENIRFFFVDSHALANSVPRPRRGVYAPVYTPSGVAAFARDPE